MPRAARTRRNALRSSICTRASGWTSNTFVRVHTCPMRSRPSRCCSGIFAPATNAQLREKSTGVAQRSLHMQGRAIDVRITQVDCAALAAGAEKLKRGGVGYYRASDFVHLDTGAFRTWKG